MFDDEEAIELFGADFVNAINEAVKKNEEELNNTSNDNNE